MSDISYEEFMKVVNEIGYGKAGDGDSYYTQEFLDESKKRRLKPKKASVGKRVIK